MSVNNSVLKVLVGGLNFVSILIAFVHFPLIRKMMETTFSQCLQTIVMSCPAVNKLMDLWPALKIESKVIWISSLF